MQVSPGPAIVRTTDARGNVRLPIAQPGTYTLRVTADGYRSVAETVQISNQNSINVTLAASAGALRVIGSVTGHATMPFNDTPVSQKIYPREAYRDQGQPDVTSVLNQTPGALALTNVATNAAVPLAPAFPSVRGAQPYETPVLIDGEPILTPSGTLDLSLLPTYVLQGVEIVKGPGDVADAGGGVGGAVNFRTADPTLGQRGTFEIEGDSRGGSFSDLAYDGTEPGGAVAYATMFSIDGSPCCGNDPADYTRKAELVKLRLTPSQGFTVTGTFMNVSLDRNLDSLYVDGEAPGDGYEHLGFGDLTLALDRGSDAYSLRLFTAQTQQGVADPYLIPNGTDTESGMTLAWTHGSGKLNFSTSTRSLEDGIAGTALDETRASIFENVAYRPDARDEFDVSGALNSDRTSHGAFEGPSARLGYARSLTDSLALRASYGSSAVDPPLEALAPSSFGPSNVSSIERATGGDFGVEWRLHGDTTTLSADVYQSDVQSPYFAFPFAGIVVGPPPATERGAELTLQQFKRVGLGFITALQLPRSYSSAAPTFANAIYPFRIPYAQGYGELSYKWPRGSRASIGALYVGSNNAYGAPAFVTMNANLELSLGSRAKLQFSALNLTNALANRAPLYVPLAASPQYGLQPFTLRFMFRQSFGTGHLYEH